MSGQYSSTYKIWDAKTAAAIIAEHKDLPGATLPILHALQEEFGFVHPDCVPEIAEALNLSRAEIHGVITFYHDFRGSLPGRRVVKLCRAEACQSVGCENLVQHLKHEHSVEMDTTSADGNLTVETIYCLGNCALGPSALVDGELIGRVDAALLDDICQMRSNPKFGADA